MSGQESNIDRLLKARAQIDEELRRDKTALSVLFTDVVGAAAYFDRHADAAGLAVLQRQAELAANTVAEFHGRVARTAFDSVMAEFPESAFAVRAAVELQRRLLLLNQQRPERERVQFRIGINHGQVLRHGDDLYGDAVNLAACITKRTGPGQILISRSVRDAIILDTDLRCTWLGKITLEGKAEKEDIFEVIWTDIATYADLRQAATAALARGELSSPGARLDDFLQPGRPPTPVPPAALTADLTPTPAPASLTARYDILGEAGSGGMGIVYRARDRETGELVALKLLKPEIAADPAVAERFKNELRLARKITHKNVCRIHEFNRTDGTAYISMEFVDGESLRYILNRFGTLSLRKGIQIAQQICAGLREAHAQGIVHRDLKPENVMLDRAGNVKVMDFGIARSIDTGTTTRAIVGTPAYMAPEQAEGRPVDARTDIYALGLILYEMFTGEVAFRGDTPVAVAFKQVHQTPSTPRELEPTLPDYIEKAILKCLEKNPAKRFQSLDALEAALTKKPEPKPTVAEAEGAEVTLPLHLATWQRSDWLLLGSAVVSAVVFLVLFYRVHPASALEISVDRAQAEQIVTDTLRKLGLSLKVERPWFQFGASEYYKVASVVGSGVAHRVLAEKESVGYWVVGLSAPEDQRKYLPAVCIVDMKGRIGYLRLPQVASPESPPGAAPDSTATAHMRSIAQRQLAALFGQDVSAIEPSVSVSPKGLSGNVIPPSAAQSCARGIAFVWRVPQKPAGLVQTLKATVEDSTVVELLRRYELDPSVFDRPSGWLAAYTPRARGFLLAGPLMVLFALGLFLVRKIYHQRRSSGNLALAVLVGLVVAGIAFSIQEKATAPGATFLRVVEPVIALCICTLLAYAALSTVLYYLRARFAVQVAGYLLLPRQRLFARPSGLELLRGTLAGIAFSGGWLAVVWFAGLWGKAQVGMLFMGEFASEVHAGAAFWTVFLLYEVLLVAWLLVAFPLSLLIKASRHWPVLLGALSALWLASGYTLTGPMAFPQFAYHLACAAQAILLGWVFLRYGLLATLSAILTVETSLFAFPMWKIFHRLEPWGYSLPLAIWLLVLIATSIIYLRPQLATVFRRVAAIFE